MFEIGSTLRRARESRGLELNDVARVLRIRARYLNALEDERWFLLPGRAYAKAFLREYAEHLGLDGDLFAHEYEERFPPEEPAIVPEPLPRRRSLRISSTALIAGATLLFLLLAWRSAGDEPRRERPIALTGAPVVAKPVVQRRPVRVLPKPKPRPRVLVLAAVRGPSWLHVKRGSHTVYYAVLPHGKSLRLKPNGLWIRIGAPNNLRAELAGRPLALPKDTASVVVARSRLRVV